MKAYKKELKENLVQIKLTEKEKKILQENARKKGLAVSQYIRIQCIYN